MRRREFIAQEPQVLTLGPTRSNPEPTREYFLLRPMHSGSGVAGLRFHDFRHEAVSRFFERGLSMPEVAAISGHRDARMLMRYSHPRPEAIAEKLG